MAQKSDVQTIHVFSNPVTIEKMLLSQYTCYFSYFKALNDITVFLNYIRYLPASSGKKLHVIISINDVVQINLIP